MIQMFAKESKAGGPVVMLGLVPENVKQIRAGNPLVVRFRNISPDCPDYTLTLALDEHLCPAAEKDRGKHISVSMHGNVLDKFLRRRLWEIPIPGNPTLLTPSMTLVLFYAESEDKFAADLIESGVSIQDFRDLRGGAN